MQANKDDTMWRSHAAQRVNHVFVIVFKQTQAKKLTNDSIPDHEFPI